MREVSILSEMSANTHIVAKGIICITCIIISKRTFSVNQINLTGVFLLKPSATVLLFFNAIDVCPNLGV